MGEQPWVELRFGACVPPLVAQLAGSGVTATAKNIQAWQRLADAIVDLHMAGIVSDAEALKARRRLYKRIAASVVRAKQPTTVELNNG